MKHYRVIQAYTGEIARHQIRVIAACPWLELVGAYVYHQDKAGQDAGVLAGIDPLGVIATTDIDEVLALEADVVLYNPPLERYDEVIQFLASGKNVISIMAGWNPKQQECHPDIVAACEQGNASLYGTGLNPGLSYELALLASSVSTDVESVSIRTCEPQASLSPVFLETFGFGKTEEQLSEAGDITYAIFKNLLDITDLICEKLQLPVDGRDFQVTYEPATKDYVDKVIVRKGTMAGLLVTAASTCQGRAVASIEVRFLLGEDYVSEAFLRDRPKQGWIEVTVQGNPVSRLMHEVVMDEDVVGTWATGTRALNAIPAVCEAASGLLSPVDLPLQHSLALSSG